MGEAKRRGTLEQRKAQAVIRRQAEEARRAEKRAQEAADRRRLASERQALMTTEERKEAVMVAGGAGVRSRAQLAALLGVALGASAPLIVVDRERKK